jgi:hypothetical protein
MEVGVQAYCDTDSTQVLLDQDESSPSPFTGRLSKEELLRNSPERVYKGRKHSKGMTSETFARRPLIAIMFSAFKRSIVSPICD